MKQPIDKENEQFKRTSTRGVFDETKKEKLQLKQKEGKLHIPNQTRSQFLMAHTQRNLNTDHINFKVYHILTKPWTFINAYSNISPKKSSLTLEKNSEEITTGLFSVESAIAIAQEFKNKTYKHKPLRQTWISKPGKKKRQPIDTAIQKDCIVQEAVRGILEAIYEPEFKEFEKLNNYTCTNYGFRPQKSCFDAVNNYKSTSRECKTIIEGDIIEAYNNVNHNKLIKILSHRIRDKKFLKVIRNLLEAGIIENDGRITNNLNGTPQGGILSPLLFNIYMFEFDKHIYNRYIKHTRVEDTRNIEVKQEQYKKIKYLYKSLKTNSFELAKIPRDSNAKTLSTKDPYENCSTYIRYADDWIFATRKNKRECKQIKAEITQYLKDELFMELDPTKTLITVVNEGISFLGWSIYKQSYNKRTTSGPSKIAIEPDINRILNKLTTLRYCRKDGFPIAQVYLLDLPEYYIVQKFNEILRGLANYYSNCDRPSKLNRTHYILTYSCLKTIARRKKISLRQVIKNYGKSAKFTTILKYCNLKTGTSETKTKTIQLMSYEKFIEIIKSKKRSVFNTHVVSWKQQRKQDDPFKVLKGSTKKLLK